MTDRELTSSLMSIHELFSGGNKYKVPAYQREYSWTKEQVNDFVTDISGLVGSNRPKKKPYFFGAMVFVREPNSDDSEDIFKIVDGQQRLITSAILIAVIRDMLFGMNEVEAADEFRRYVQEKDLESEQFFDRIIPSDRNREFFKNNVMKAGKPDEKNRAEEGDVKVANVGLFNAYKIIHKALAEEHSSRTDLISLGDRFVKNFKVIVVIVSSNNDAYRIFETLNDRGLELSEGDLVKNYLMEKCADDERLQGCVFDAWVGIMDSLDSPDNHDKIKIDEFLRYFWLANRKKIGSGDIYSEISGTVSTPGGVKELVDKMSRYAAIYSQIVNPEGEEWGDDRVVTSLKTLKILNSKICYVALMAGRDRLSADDFAELAETCVNFFFRYKTICGKHTTKLETMMVAVAKDLRGGENLGDVKKRHFLDLNMYPTDDEFERAFAKARLSKKIATYVLKRLHGVPHADQAFVEYIIPKNIQGTEWVESIKKKDEDFKSYVEQWHSRLGNITLMENISNDDGKKPYSEKWERFYSKSSVGMTKELPRTHEWNDEQIRSRQQDFAAKAKCIWKIA